MHRKTLELQNGPPDGCERAANLLSCVQEADIAFRAQLKVSWAASTHEASAQCSQKGH